LPTIAKTIGALLNEIVDDAAKLRFSPRAAEV